MSASAATALAPTLIDEISRQTPASTYLLVVLFNIATASVPYPTTPTTKVLSKACSHMDMWNNHVQSINISADDTALRKDWTPCRNQRSGAD